MTGEIHWPSEYAATRDRVIALVRDLDQAAAATMVPACPAWSVHDVVAHVAGLAVALGDGRIPQGDVQAYLDALVDERRSLPLVAVLDEWAASAGGVGAFLEARGAGGGQLVYDLVTHEHDIRHALGRPGARDSSAVVASLEVMSTLLARDLAAHGLSGIELTSAGRTWVAGDEPAQLAIALDPFEMLRTFCSRRSEAQLRALPWRGDLERHLPGIAHMPFPTVDIVE